VTDKRGADATQRIITVLQVLADHPVRGVDVTELLTRVGSYGGNHEGQKDSLSRDLKHLRKAGFEIENVAGEGEDARYVVRPGDDKVRLAFTKEQVFELQRAAVLVGVDRLATLSGGVPRADSGASVPIIDAVQIPDGLGEVQRAVATRAVVKFDYSGRPRTIHPYGLRMAPRGWVLEGWEAESESAKIFSLQKMADVRIGRPGTASPPERSTRPTLDPLRFLLDDPADAILQVPQRFRPEVDAALHLPQLAEPAEDVAGEATELLHYRVTNHTNFLVRLLRLDERVVLLGGDAMRAALQRMLTKLAEVE